MADATYCLRCGSALERKLIDGAERLACSSASCSYVYWNNPVPVVAAIVEHEDTVLLVRQPGWPDKMYGLVTGFLERGESPEQGVVREVAEELGLTAEVVGLVGLYPFEQQNQLIVAYHVRATGTVRLSDELAGVKAIAPDRLRPWPFGTGLAVRDWLERRGSIPA
jgi:NADH pyrophosphatase NudC (nudix superfamily)